MSEAIRLLWWAAFFSGLSFGVAVCLVVALIARTHPHGASDG